MSKFFVKIKKRIIAVEFVFQQAKQNLLIIFLFIEYE